MEKTIDLRALNALGIRIVPQWQIDRLLIKQWRARVYLNRRRNDCFRRDA